MVFCSFPTEPDQTTAAHVGVLTSPSSFSNPPKISSKVWQNVSTPNSKCVILWPQRLNKPLICVKTILWKLSPLFTVMRVKTTIKWKWPLYVLRKKTEEEKNLDFRGEEGLHRNTDVIKKHIPDFGGGRGGG